MRMCTVSHAEPEIKGHTERKTKERGQEDMKIEADRLIFHMSHCSLGPRPDVTRTVFIC